MAKYIFVSCGKSKQGYSCHASEMYTGALFKKSLEYAASLNPNEIFILSAKYGLLELTTVIEPYEKTLNKMSVSDCHSWAEKVLNTLREKVNFNDDEFVFLAGKKYQENLIPQMKNVLLPLDGLTFGRQLQWLSNQQRSTNLCEKSACQCIHDHVTQLPPMDKSALDACSISNGLYFIYEKHERSHGRDRIVRIGTHTGDGNLIKRIFEHTFTPNKDRSIFRKHIGRCILAKRNDPFLKQWELDLTSKVAREDSENNIDLKMLANVESEVTDNVNTNLSFRIFEVKDKWHRLSAEAALLSTIAACSDCGASKHWLGNSHPRKNIGQAGLWNVQGLNGESLSVDEVNDFFEVNP
tara:strand:+ start:134 stop:1192 length:1059 start_codon:yes stop_codon:yes gene_type:complete